MAIELRRDWDLYIMMGLTLLLIPVIYLFPDSFVRTVIGLPFLLFFPGYLAIAALFPRKDDLDSIERVALSFGLSIAITPLIGFGLNYTPWGIRLDPILFSISGFNLLVALAALQRRNSVREPYLPFDPFVTVEGVWREFQKEQGIDKALSVILALSILSSVIALAYVIAFPRQGESFTEFYILGPDGRASGYPSSLVVTEEATIIIGLANHEHRTVNYTIVIWLANLSFVDNQTVVNELYHFDTIRPITLEHVPVDIEGPWQKQWEMNYTFSIDTLFGNDEEWRGKLWFSLYKEDHDPGYVPLQDYSDDEEAVQSIIDGVKNKRLSLNLNLRVSAATEFFVLEVDQSPITRSLNMTANVTETLLVGLSNHNLRPVNYSIVVWVANTTVVSNNTTVNSLYFIDVLTPGTLPHIDVNNEANLTAQWTLDYDLLINSTFGGSPYRGHLYFDLHIDEAAGTYTPLQNYSGDQDASSRIIAIGNGTAPGKVLRLAISP